MTSYEQFLESELIEIINSDKTTAQEYDKATLDVETKPAHERESTMTSYEQFLESEEARLIAIINGDETTAQEYDKATADLADVLQALLYIRDPE